MLLFVVGAPINGVKSPSDDTTRNQPKFLDDYVVVCTDDRGPASSWYSFLFRSGSKYPKTVARTWPYSGMKSQKRRERHKTHAKADITQLFIFHST
jgi:hypothetical protein